MSDTSPSPDLFGAPDADQSANSALDLATARRLVAEAAGTKRRGRKPKALIEAEALLTAAGESIPTGDNAAAGSSDSAAGNVAAPAPSLSELRAKFGKSTPQAVLVNVPATAPADASPPAAAPAPVLPEIRPVEVNLAASHEHHAHKKPTRDVEVVQLDLSKIHAQFANSAPAPAPAPAPAESSASAKAAASDADEKKTAAGSEADEDDDDYFAQESFSFDPDEEFPSASDGQPRVAAPASAGDEPLDDIEARQRARDAQLNQAAFFSGTRKDSNFPQLAAFPDRQTSQTNPTDQPNQPSQPNQQPNQPNQSQQQQGNRHQNQQGNRHQNQQGNRQNQQGNRQQNQRQNNHGGENRQGGNQSNNQGRQNNAGGTGNAGNQSKDKFRDKQRQQLNVPRQWGNVTLGESVDERPLDLGTAFNYAALNQPGALEPLLAEATALTGEPLEFDTVYNLPDADVMTLAKTLNLRWQRMPQHRTKIGDIIRAATAAGCPLIMAGTLEILEDGNGLLVYLRDNYRICDLSAFVPKTLIEKHGLLRGHEISALAVPPRAGETVPIVVRIDKVMGEDPDVVTGWTPFTDLTPYYPTQRIFLECAPTDTTTAGGSVKVADNLSMRCVDLLCPIGFGQRGLIVAPPRTGKTILLQNMANAIVRNAPQAHLIVLLVDERPEEVTDFKRMVKQAEIVSSTFDESAESHVHAAEIVIERSRRMVEAGRHVIILLDSITRLARAYNTMMPSTGKILSGGVESNALAKPKRFFGSARNIEGGGSLTILGTALIETGSKMDEVIFEEFKGTGNMELDLDRDLSNKRIFPAISFERSGTRKEELLYHPDELQKVYALRRAMKGIPSADAMEQLIQRIKKTKTNIEFLLTCGNPR